MVKDATGKKTKVEFSLATIQSNTATRKQLEGFVEELVLCHEKIKSEKEAIKDIMSEAKDSLGIPSKILGKLVKENMAPGTIEADIHTLEEAQAISEAIDGQPIANFSDQS
jgi:uncharacterized protein (UPF0335 family)